MKKKLILAAVVALVSGGVFIATAGHAGALPLCGGNQTVQTAPLTCTNSKTFTFGAAQRTVTVVLDFQGDGNATATYTLDKTVAQPFDLRVRSHAGVSSIPGNLVDDQTATFPANSLGPVVVAFKFDCGQIDVKAVFTGAGDSRGRVAGPYVCKQVVETTTTTAPTTTVAGATTTVAGTVGSTALAATAKAGVAGQIPATGNEVWVKLGAVVLTLLVGLGLISAARSRSAP